MVYHDNDNNQWSEDAEAPDNFEHSHEKRLFV